MMSTGDLFRNVRLSCGSYSCSRLQGAKGASKKCKAFIFGNERAPMPRDMLIGRARGIYA